MAVFRSCASCDASSACVFEIRKTLRRWIHAVERRGLNQGGVAVPIALECLQYPAARVVLPRTEAADVFGPTGLAQLRVGYGFADTRTRRAGDPAVVVIRPSSPNRSHPLLTM